MKLPFRSPFRRPAPPRTDHTTPVPTAPLPGMVPPTSRPEPTAAARAAHDQILEMIRRGGGGAYGYAGLRSPADAAEVLGHLGRLAGDLDQVLRQIDGYLRREDSEGRLRAVDGPFTDDASAAVATVHMWLSQAGIASEQLREALDNAHIAAGGLARTERTDA